MKLAGAGGVSNTLLTQRQAAVLERHLGTCAHPPAACACRAQISKEAKPCSNEVLKKQYGGNLLTHRVCDSVRSCHTAWSLTPCHNHAVGCGLTV
jgi:hypothetical protein